MFLVIDGKKAEEGGGGSNIFISDYFIFKTVHC